MKMTRSSIFIALALSATSGLVLADDDSFEAWRHDAKPPASVQHDPHLMGDRYQQSSAEVAGLQVQAYNIATRRLDRMLNERNSSLPPAVVLDIDETVLDNMPYQAAAVTHDFSFPAHWGQWIDAAEAPLIPGAKAFLEYADARGVAIFYVSNRKAEHETATIANLKRHNLPQVSNDSVRLLGPSKKVRRDAIAQDHDILLLIGDTLHDFDAEFAGTSLAAQRAAVTRMQAAFGQRFIVLPNAAYGSWHDARLRAWQPPADAFQATAQAQPKPKPNAERDTDDAAHAGS
ncbi:5'-nucleotidase, lipoprotein e(P4) family [Salinisphaera sp. SPP-AMP-43]|uniref:5'-nucleotidase, lipoprotein e(P4) family n=1 Tax=Salinisphaera sp. SPP-AMP-43 TaxID=3121288 RepID=UPI003C6DFE79